MQFERSSFRSYYFCMRHQTQVHVAMGQESSVSLIIFVWDVQLTAAYGRFFGDRATIEFNAFRFIFRVHPTFSSFFIFFVPGARFQL